MFSSKGAAVDVSLLCVEVSCCHMEARSCHGSSQASFLLFCTNFHVCYAFAPLLYCLVAF